MGWQYLVQTVKRLEKEVRALRNPTITRGGLNDSITVSGDSVTFNIREEKKTSSKGGGVAINPSNPWEPYSSKYTGGGTEPADQLRRIKIIPGTVANRVATNWDDEFIVPADSVGRWFWAEVTIIDTGAVTGVEINQGASPPVADLVNTDGTLPTTLYAPLFSVDSDADKVTKFYISQDENLSVIINDNGGNCSTLRRSVYLQDSTGYGF